MLELNSVLIYGSSGICKVTDIRKEKLGKEIREYYILQPLGDNKSVVYVPTDNEGLQNKMRKIISTEEIKSLIKNMPENETIWIDDDRKRNEAYKSILESGDHVGVIKVIKTLFFRRKELTAVGKKLRTTDEAIMQRAEKMLYEEFALVLNISRDEVLPFILDHVIDGSKPSIGIN